MGARALILAALRDGYRVAPGEALPLVTIAKDAAFGVLAGSALILDAVLLLAIGAGR